MSAQPPGALGETQLAQAAEWDVGLTQVQDRKDVQDPGKRARPEADEAHTAVAQAECEQEIPHHQRQPHAVL